MSDASKGSKQTSPAPQRAVREKSSRSSATTSPRPAIRDATLAYIIVPLDGSPFAEHALPLACLIARQAGTRGRVELVHVHDPGVYAANAPALEPAWENERAAEMSVDLDAVAARLAAETKLRVTAVTLRGRVAESIAVHAAERGADLIVMTTHGRSGIKRAILGSVTERVLRTAAVPVLVVPSPEAHAE